MKKRSYLLIFLMLFALSFVSATNIVDDDSQNSTFTTNITGVNYWIFMKLPWTFLQGVPSGFSDNIDNDTQYTNGSGISLVGTQINHSDTSSVSNSDNSGNTFIQDLTFDTFGHVLTVVTNTVDFTGYLTQVLTSDIVDGTIRDIDLNLSNITISDFTNDANYINNQTMNKSVSCNDIIGGSDGDYCTDTSGAGGGNTTEEMVDAVLSQANHTITYSDAGDSWGVNKTWFSQNVTGYGYITSYTETDPKWNANYSLGTLSYLGSGIATGEIDNDTITYWDIAYTIYNAMNPALGAWESYFGKFGLLFEGATADTNEGTLLANSITADRNWTLPDATGDVVVLSANGLGTRTASGTFASRTITAGSNGGLSVSNGNGVSGNPTISLSTSTALSGDVGLSANTEIFGQNGIIFEGSSADTIETFFKVLNPTGSDKYIYVPDASGQLILNTSNFGGDVSGTAGSITIASNFWKDTDNGFNKTSADTLYEPISTHFDASATTNITCFNTACTWYMNATDSCEYLSNGGKECAI